MGRKYFELIKPATEVLYGDIVIYSFSHIGIASSGTRGGNFWNVEGNTDASGRREGDGTYLRRRPLSSVRSVIRLLS